MSRRGGFSAAARIREASSRVSERTDRLLFAFGGVASSAGLTPISFQRRARVNAVFSTPVGGAHGAGRQPTRQHAAVGLIDMACGQFGQGHRADQGADTADVVAVVDQRGDLVIAGLRECRQPALQEAAEVVTLGIADALLLDLDRHFRGIGLGLRHFDEAALAVGAAFAVDASRQFPDGAPALGAAGQSVGRDTWAISGSPAFLRGGRNCGN